MNMKKVNEEVFYTEDAVTKVAKEDIEFLKTKARENPRKRVRLCSHRNIQDSIHEMLIVFAKGAYVRPHKHLKEIVSYHIIEGRLKFVIFDDAGNILEVFNMGDYHSGEIFYYRFSESFYCTLVPISDFVVFHETTKGPFRREDTPFAPWAPKDEEHEAKELYLDKLDALDKY